MVLIVLQLYDDAGDVILADRCVMGVVVSSNDHVVAFNPLYVRISKGERKNLRPLGIGWCRCKRTLCRTLRWYRIDEERTWWRLAVKSGSYDSLKPPRGFCVIPKIVASLPRKLTEMLGFAVRYTLFFNSSWFNTAAGAMSWFIARRIARMFA